MSSMTRCTRIQESWWSVPSPAGSARWCGWLYSRPSVWQPVGYTVHVHADGGQPEFYASALYGWMRWWLENLDRSALPDGFPFNVLLPRPPQMVGMSMHETTVQLSIRHTARVPDRPSRSTTRTTRSTGDETGRPVPARWTNSLPR